ncbi:MAG: PEP-CTERM sorting domain-containing protein [Proteobacteria bacterium]|nr:PEP-CTERM sorting domain-containing protein [Pseudomonadota bacterium]
MDDKKNKYYVSGLMIVVFILFLLTPSINYAQTQTFTGDTSRSTKGFGNFIGEFTYRLLSPSTTTLDVTLKNISSSNNGGFLTGFAFNNPNNFISGVSVTGSNKFFSLLGASCFQDSISASPFSAFDIGAAIGGNFLGSGNTKNGIPVGGSASFIFAMTGNSLDQLSTGSFFEAKSSEGAFAITRFRGFKNGGRDKVPGTTGVPEPAMIFLLGIGLIGIVVFNKRYLKAQTK